MRDITFSAIYFPAYAHLKLLFGGESGHLNPFELFCAGFIAGKHISSLRQHVAGHVHLMLRPLRVRVVEVFPHSQVYQQQV